MEQYERSARIYIEHGNRSARRGYVAVTGYSGGVGGKATFSLSPQGVPKELNRKEKESRKAKQKAARKSRRKNRRK